MGALCADENLLNKLEQHSLIADWYGQFHDQLVVFLRRGVRSSADIQDLAQEVYFRLLRVKNPELVESPRAYLYQVAVHVLAEWRSSERKGMLHSPTGLEELIATSGEFDDPQRRSNDDELKKILLELPSAYSTVLILKWHYGMDYSEIAAHLNISERQVKRHIVKGYADLRVRLSSGPN